MKTEFSWARRTLSFFICVSVVQSMAGAAVGNADLRDGEPIVSRLLCAGGLR
jgi:hypothetical protein